MRLKNLAVLCPETSVQTAIGLKAVGGSASHVERVMRIIVNKKPLAAETKQSFDFPEPLIDLSQMLLEAAAIHRIRLAQFASRNSKNLGPHGQASLLEPCTERISDFLVGHLPLA